MKKPYYGLIIQTSDELDHVSDEKIPSDMFYKLEKDELKRKKEDNR